MDDMFTCHLVQVQMYINNVYTEQIVCTECQPCNVSNTHPQTHTTNCANRIENIRAIANVIAYMSFGLGVNNEYIYLLSYHY